MKRPILFAAVTTATALFTAGTAFADCKDDLNNLPRNFSQLAAEDGDLTSRQVRRIHAAAKILSRTGYEDACAELVDVLSGDATSSQRARGSENANNRVSGSERASETAARDTDPDMMQKAEAARPVMDDQGRFSTNGMIGSEVYSSQTGEAIGDIEDILMGNDKNFVIIGHGGLLGMGEKRIKVSMQDLSIYPRDNTFFVGLTKKEIENAQAVVKKDNRWVAKSADAARQSSATDERSQSSERSTGQRIADRASETMQSAQRSAERMVDDARTTARRSMDDQDRSDATATGSTTKLSSRSDFSANELIGSWVYASGSSERVGEIEDFIVSPSGGNPWVVLGHGGFLGLGEKRIKVDVTDIRYNQSDDRYYVTFTDEELKNAPGLQKVDGRWVGKPVGAGQSLNAPSNLDRRAGQTNPAPARTNAGDRSQN
ncbi:MAG: PRC-barrel domain-containing protein [Alphaproteobacteria bacterium]|nr:PRC-barrel domain-containing protein [Alphaproteobacteria bacterium]